MSEQDGRFKSTRWTSVLRAGQPGTVDSAPALARLCEDYRAPLLQFACTWLKSPDDAEDLTQSFFVHFIEKNLPGQIAPGRGRFRTFLLACFKNFMRDEWRRRQRAKEIPEYLVTSLSAGDAEGSPAVEPAHNPSVARQLDSLWAESIRQRVVASLERDYRKRNKSAVFTRLCCLLNGQAPDASYSQLAVALGMSKDSMKMEVLRLRERFRQRFREEVAQTVVDSRELDFECRYLMSLLFGNGNAT
ncbi:MAG: sigma-70 family RNA polymerase sigma factor [Verrucomicrobiales bacterium]|nr:sigma-70 family RNA polymerase sigma factor [Verrucomicrobiales bacterium]